MKFTAYNSRRLFFPDGIGTRKEASFLIGTQGSVLQIMEQQGESPGRLRLCVADPRLFFPQYGDVLQAAVWKMDPAKWWRSSPAQAMGCLAVARRRRPPSEDYLALDLQRPFLIDWERGWGREIHLPLQNPSFAIIDLRVVGATCAEF